MRPQQLLAAALTLSSLSAAWPWPPNMDDMKEVMGVENLFKRENWFYVRADETTTSDCKLHLLATGNVYLENPPMLTFRTQRLQRPPQQRRMPLQTPRLRREARRQPQLKRPLRPTPPPQLPAVAPIRPRKRARRPERRAARPRKPAAPRRRRRGRRARRTTPVCRRAAFR